MHRKALGGLRCRAQALHPRSAFGRLSGGYLPKRRAGIPQARAPCRHQPRRQPSHHARKRHGRRRAPSFLSVYRYLTTLPPSFKVPQGFTKVHGPGPIGLRLSWGHACFSRYLDYGAATQANAPRCVRFGFWQPIKLTSGVKPSIPLAPLLTNGRGATGARDTTRACRSIRQSTRPLRHRYG